MLHPGVIKLIAWSKTPQLMTFQRGVKKEVLFTVMELAENGDFYCYVNINFEKLKDPNHPDYPFSTELTRYYFKQLIETVEYLHL